MPLSVSIIFSIIYLDFEISVAEEISSLYICTMLSYLEFSLSCSNKIAAIQIKLAKFHILYCVNIGPTQYI